MSIQPLPPELLYRRCDPERFAFETTAELEDLTEVVGQARAVEAVRFGVGMRSEGYNLFALGPYGTGKHTAVAHFLKQKAAEEPAPPDWCYVHNFSQPHRPNALQLPAGQGNALGEDMRKFVEELFTVLPVAFGGEDYQSQKKAVEEEFKEKQESAFEELKREARERDIVLIPTPNGLAFAPLHKGEVISPDDFLKLPDEEQKRVETEVAALQEQLQKILYQLPQWKRESQARLKTLNQEVARFAVTPLIEELRAKYTELPDVLAYLQSVQGDVVEHTERLLEMQEGQAQSSPGAPPAALMTRYQVNVVVSNSRDNGAPVIYEDHPTYQNLIGRVEHLAEMGVLTTDFTLIKPGVLHRANGGYVILDALKVLQQPYAWEGLKRALRSGEITIESLGQIFSLISTVSLTPQPIPLNVKVVLLGERLLYYLLCQFDPDFMELFKVAVDFEDEIERSDENYRLYARLIGTLARKEKLPHFDRRAVARVLEHSSRLAEDSEKLSTHMQQTADLLRESGYWARQAGREIAQAEDVQRAIDAATFRHGRIRERMQEAILRETVLIDTTGATVGQINGLSVIALGNTTFGRPSRITARVRLGKGEVMDIERQVELGGPIHSKGVLILSSFLASRYAAERPLSLSASLVFEQSYSGVEGDSASSAELYALLSALAGVPIKQSLAVTGSVNQRGQVQAIGGVNEKIEGFFDICQARGLTGGQGVLIPQANVKHLMLRPDVVAAAAAGQFHVYPVETVDQGIELLTGVPAGELDEEGHYPEGTINYLVEARLVALAEKMREFGKEKKDEG